MVTRRARRRRIWTNDHSTITVGTLGVPGQIFRHVDANVLLNTSLASMFGSTVARTHTCVLIDSSTNTGTTLMKAYLGMGVFPQGMDNGDFPDLEQYNGDYFAWECFSFQMPGAANTLVLPSEAAFTRQDYRSMRKIPRTEERVNVVLQIDATEIVRFHLQIAMLFLLP